MQSVQLSKGNKNMYFFMYRNRLEILKSLLELKHTANYLVIEILLLSKKRLKKNNYREYMKKIVIGYNPIKKVLLRVASNEGKAHPDFWLICKNLNLVKRIGEYFKNTNLINPIDKGFIKPFNQICVFVYFDLFLVNLGLKRA